MRTGRILRRFGGHGAPRFLRRATAHVNSKAFWPGTPARAVTGKFLFEEPNDHRLEQTGGDRTYNPRNRLALDRAPNFTRQINFLANAIQSEREIFARTRDLLF